MGHAQEYPRKVRDHTQPGYVYVPDGTTVREWVMTEPDDVTETVIEEGQNIVEGWYMDCPIEWEDLVNRLEEYLLGKGPDGRDLVFDDQMDGPALRKLQRELRRFKREAE